MKMFYAILGVSIALVLTFAFINALYIFAILGVAFILEKLYYTARWFERTFGGKKWDR